MRELVNSLLYLTLSLPAVSENLVHAELNCERQKVVDGWIFNKIFVRLQQICEHLRKTVALGSRAILRGRAAHRSTNYFKHISTNDDNVSADH